MKLVLDTSLLIDKLRNGRQWERFLRNVNKDAEIFLPTVVIFEIYSGTSSRTTEANKKIQKILRFMQRVDLNETIAKRAGEIYRDISSHFSVADYLIAATALEIGAEVATLNRRHFVKIPGVRIYDF